MWVARRRPDISTLLNGMLLLTPWRDPVRRMTYNGIVVGKETEFHIDITYGGETVHVLMLDHGGLRRALRPKSVPVRGRRPVSDAVEVGERHAAPARRGCLGDHLGRGP